MEEFRKYFNKVAGQKEWQISDKCQNVAHDIIERFIEYVPADSNGSVEICKKVAEGLYIGSDSVSDIFQKEGIDGIELWKTLHIEINKVYGKNSIVLGIANYAILSQEARCYNDTAFKKYSETGSVDDILTISAVNCLLKMVPYAFNIPVYSLEPYLEDFLSSYFRKVFANTFRQFNMSLYNKDEFQDIFVQFYLKFSKSGIIINAFGVDLVERAMQIVSQLDKKSKYRSSYLTYSKSILEHIK
jgi:hypothetical protein